MPSSKPIVGVARIVDAVLVDDQRADEAAELQQRVPIPAIAGETRGLDRDHGADPPLADRGEELLEARPGDAGAGAAEIIVDHLNGRPAQRPGAIGKSILPPAALVVVEDLIGRRLADVDHSAAGEVLSRDLGHGRPPRPIGSSARDACAGRFRQQCLEQKRELGPQVRPKVRKHRLSLEQIPLAASLPHGRRLLVHRANPLGTRLGAP